MRLQSFFALLVALWVVGFVIGYVVCFRRARAELGEVGEMKRLSSVLWMGERDRSWTLVGRVTLVWWLGIPVMLILLVGLARIGVIHN